MANNANPAIGRNAPPRPDTLSRVQSNQVKKRRKEGRFKKFLKTPKGLVFSLLVILMLIGQWHAGQLDGIRNVGVAFVTGVVVDYIIGKLRHNKRLLPDGAMVTSLIIGLVLSATAPWYQAALVMALALLSKHLLVLNRKPIFNPAAFGLLVSLFVFHTNQSWWGGLSLLPTWTIPILLIVGFMIAKKVNKFPQVFTYFGVYFLLFVLVTALHIQDVTAIYRAPLINTTLFLGFVMLTDPPTSPAKYRHQMIFAALAGLISGVVYLDIGGLAYPLIGLLVANAWKAVKFRNPEKNTRKGKVKTKPRMAEGRA